MEKTENQKQNQQKVWDKIAPEWFEFKDKKRKYKNKFQIGVSEFLEKQRGNVLDLGAGTGRYLTKIKNGKMWIVDFSKEMVKFAKQKAKKQKIPAEFVISYSDKLPFNNNFFDAAICICVLHNIPLKIKRERTIKEIYRVLKPRAKAQISVWNKESTRFKNKKKEDYVRWRDKGSRYYYFYTENELEKDLKKAGFKIKSQSSKIKGYPYHTITFIVQKPKT